MQKNKQMVSVGCAIVFRDSKGKLQFFLVKQKEDDTDWEIPKVTVRRGESSVRSVIRLIGEQAGMSTRVLEEAGRSTSSTIINSKPVQQKLYYYIMLQKAGGDDPVGFHDYKWFDYTQITKKLSLKREKEMIKNARDFIKQWQKQRKKR